MLTVVSHNGLRSPAANNLRVLTEKLSAVGVHWDCYAARLIINFIHAIFLILNDFFKYFFDLFSISWIV